MKTEFLTKLTAITLSLSALISGSALAQPTISRTSTNAQLGPPYRKDRVLIRVKPGTTTAQMNSVHPQGATVRSAYTNRIWVINLPAGMDARSAIPVYESSGLVEYAELDLIQKIFVTPNDTSFGEQWSLNNTGQSGGTPDADIDAPEGWDTQSTAPNVVVAIVDTGARLNHEDLVDNLWINPVESGMDDLGRDKSTNGVDDDGNGYVDDVHGINVVAHSGNPADDAGHGTHVAGIIGARGNNGKGIAGVAWQVKLMILKFLNQDGFGSASDAIICMEYARTHGASIINASWGAAYSSMSLWLEIAALRSSGIIVVVAAGNDGLDNDRLLTFPACYNWDNVVPVAATTRNNTLADYSCFGYQYVALGAPGSDIKSTWFTANNAYANLDGTSMATPHVAGALALLKAKVPTDSYLGTINRLLSSVDRISALEGKVTSGGLLNLNNALRTATQASPDNDNFANRQALTGAATTVYGRNIGATKETGEPNHAGNAGGKSVWYTWTAPYSGLVEVTTAKSITTAGASWNTLLAVYTGTSVSALTLQASNDDSGIAGDGSGTSRLTFNATVGTAYQIAVDGFGGASGFIRLAIAYAPLNDNLANAYKLNGPWITFEGTSLGATKEGSEPAHAGNAGGRSLWWSWKAPVSGTVVLTTAGSTIDTLLAVYTGSSYPLTLVASNNDDADPVLKDQYGGLTSSLTFSATAGTTYKIAVDGSGGAAGRIVLAGGYQYSINTPSDVATYPATASGINLAGHYAGIQSGNPHAYIFTGSQLDLGDLGGGTSFAYGLNSLDIVVGDAPISGVDHAFIWDAANGMRRLDNSTSLSVALGINDVGTAVGFARVYSCDPSHPYDGPVYWTNGNFTVLPDLGGGARAFALDINNLNEISGWSSTSIPPGCDWDLVPVHAVYWRLNQSGVETVDLGNLGGNYAAAIAINSGGQVAGESITVGQRLFSTLFSDRKAVNLGTIGAGESHEGDVNNRLQVAATYVTTNRVPLNPRGNPAFDIGERAGLWQNGVFVDLNKMIPPQPANNGWKFLESCSDMNERGTVIGTGWFTNAFWQDKALAFILIPPTTIQSENPGLSANNLFSFTVVGPNGANCTVEAATDLAAPSWANLGSLTLVNGTATFTDNNSPSFPVRFYRVSSGSQTSGDVVGYLVRTVPAGQSMVSNPFDSVDNRINALFSGAGDGSTINKWDETTQAFHSATKLLGTWNDSLMTIYPGEGVIINTAGAFTQKCVGRVRQNCVSKEASSLQAVHSSLVALGGSADGTLRFPVAHGDTISRMTGTDGSYTTYMYQNGSWTPSQPSISLGEAFWSNKSRPAIWRQNHSVW